MKHLLTICVLILLITSCTTNSPTAIPSPQLVASPMPTLTAIPQLPSEPAVLSDPRQMMLFSHTYWRSIWVDALYISYAGDAANTPTDIQRIQLWVRQPQQGRVVSGQQNSSPDRLWLSDGKNAQENNHQIYPLPDYSSYTFTPSTNDDSIEPHPFGSSLGTLLSDYIFSTSLAQRTGEYRLVGQELLLGRDTQVVEYYRWHDGPVIDRLWVDAETGVLLHYVNFGKPAGGPLFAEMIVNKIEYDLEFSANTFELGQELPATYAADPYDIP